MGLIAIHRPAHRPHASPHLLAVLQVTGSVHRDQQLACWAGRERAGTSADQLPLDAWGAVAGICAASCRTGGAEQGARPASLSPVVAAMVAEA